MFVMNINCSKLPNSFENEIVKDVDNECVIRSSVKDMNEIEVWVKEFGLNTLTHWNSRKSNPNGVRITCMKKFVCHHSSFMKTSRESNKRGISKNTSCEASITAKVKVNTKDTRKKDKFVKNGLCGIIVIKKIHTHTLNTSETLRFLPAQDQSREKFLNYFNAGMSVTEAAKYHEAVLQLEDCSEIDFANAQINPTARTIKHWHNVWKTSNLGPRTGPGLIDKLKEKQKTYEEERGSTIVHCENPFAVVILTPLMKRAHQLESSKNIVFVDSTNSCDVESHCLTFLLTPCAAGVVPLGIIITKGQTFDSYRAGFKLLQTVLENNGFAGQTYPKLFLTDYSQAKINSIKSVWPESKTLLRIFHVAQAVWRWLWDFKHSSIPKEERPKLMTEFQNIMYASSCEEAAENFNKALQSGNKYHLWENYITEYWEIKEQWCLAWRDETINGHHTNNFSEVTVQLFKDIVLSRVKAYNVVALVDFSCTALEEYYCKQLRKFAYSSTASAKLLLKNMLEKTNYLNKGEIIQQNEDNYTVPSERDNSLKYTVNVATGSCSCVFGKFGIFCKHQCAVYQCFGVASEKCFPPITAADRHAVAFLGLGEKVPPLSFDDSFLPSQSIIFNGKSSNTEIEQDEDRGLLSSTESENSPDQERTFETTDTAEKQMDTIFKLLQKCNDTFGSSLCGLKKLEETLTRISTEAQWEAFLHTAGNDILLRKRAGVPIRIQPIPLARRSIKVTRGSKRLPPGRLAANKPAKKKCKRNVALNVQLNQCNAKSHGSSH